MNKLTTTVVQAFIFCLQGGLSGRHVTKGKGSRPGVSDPAVCLQYQNQIKSRYRGSSSSPQSGNEVSVMALSDSDTTASPTLGSSSASEKFREAEAFSLSLDLRGDSSGFNTPEVKSAKSSTSGDEKNETVVDEVENSFIADDTCQIFTRNGENRASDISDNSSVSQGIQADKDFGKRGSDISDPGIASEGRLTPKNQKDLESYLQITDESGIVSETTSSNQSEGSQQSDQTNFKFDPTEIAQKIMNDVSKQKTALDSMQIFNSFQTQQEVNSMRSEYQKQLPQFPVDAPGRGGVEIKSQVEEPNSVQSKMAAFSETNQSAFTSPQHKPRPPPVATKPTFHSDMSTFRNLSANVTNLSDISQKDLISDSKMDTSVNRLGTVPTQSNVFTTAAIVVSKKDTFSATANAGTTMSFTSFRPTGKQNPGDSSLYRPDSTTSTSSYCSTPSSMQSVIYRPNAEVRNPDSPCVVSYDSSSDQTSGSGSASTVTSTTNMTEPSHTDLVPSLKRDSSPALSSCSSTSGRSNKQKKKVSFSDSEPSDTPSPLDSSASSNQLSYFELQKSKLSTLPVRSSNLKSGPDSQYSQQNLSNSSIDSIGLNRSGSSGARPPPPSYQYAIRNSQFLNKSLDERITRPVLQQQISAPGYSSGSSLNNSLDEINRVPNGLGRSQGTLPLQQSSPVHAGQPLPTQRQPQHTMSFSQPNTASAVTGNQQRSPLRQNDSFNLPPHMAARNMNPSLSPVRQNPVNAVPTSPPTPEIPPRGIPPAQRPSHMNLPLSHPLDQMSRSQHQNASPGQQQMSRPQPFPGNIAQGQMNGSHQGLVNGPNPLPAKTALLRQPLSSPDSNITPQDYFQRASSQPRETVDNFVRMNTHQNAVNAFAQSSCQRSQSLDQISKYSGNPNPNAMKSPSQSVEMKDLPQRFASSYSLNQSSALEFKNLTDHQLNGPIRSPQFTIYPPSSQIALRGSNAPVRRNPPVPPARIDSWENMDRHGNSQSVSQEHLASTNQYLAQPNYGPPQIGQKGSNSGSIQGLNGYMREQTGHYLTQMYNKQAPGPVPSSNHLTQSPQNYANGSIPGLNQPTQNSVGPLRRVGIGSDKKSFAKTSVIQASKC